MKKTIKATNKNHLLKLINREIRLHGNQCDLSHINVYNVIDISYLFAKSEFNGDISKWNLSNVKNMHYLFAESEFNGDISGWNVSNATDMSFLFSNSKFNGDISKWNVSNVTNMESLFHGSQFNGDISSLRPIKPESNNDTFLHCSATIPYRGLCKNNEEVRQAINSHDLSEQLNSNLTVKNIFKNNKIKI